MMSSFKRIFIGSFIDVKGIDKELTYIKKDFGGIISGKWTKTENLHITYKFIGQVPVERIIAIREALDDFIDTHIQANLVLKGIGVFPNIKEPKILYIKVESDILNTIKMEIEDRLYRIGFKKDTKPFIPHITINRIKEAKSFQLLEKVEKFELKNFGYQPIVSINIIESILNHTGAEYRII